MRCTVCGTENPDNARFCGSCGSPAHEAFADTDSSPFADPTAPSTNPGSVEPTEEYASDSVFEPISESLSESAQADNDETAPEFTPDPDTNASAYEQPAVSPTPIPVPSAPKRSIFSDNSLGNSFGSQENPAVPEQDSMHKDEKEKKVVSLSVAVICIIAVFILAVACGIFIQLYMQKSSRADYAAGTSYSSSKTSQDKNGQYEYVLSYDSEISVYCKGE